MSLLTRLALLFVIVPILELVVLIQLGQVFGLLPTLALILFTGILGAGLARAEGLRALWTFQQQVAQGHLPGQALFDGLSVLLGGALLLTPGLITDLFGFSLLFPPTRKLLQRRVIRRLEASVAAGTIQVGMVSPEMMRQEVRIDPEE